MLGYHRASSMEQDTASAQENKLRLFWSVYCLDKGLSLRLGRASNIQDYDISLTPTFGRGDLRDLWNSVYTLWITLSRIQGKVYELLYSPAALSQPETERVAHARRLAAEMKESVMEPFKVFLLPPGFRPHRLMLSASQHRVQQPHRRRSPLPQIGRGQPFLRPNPDIQSHPALLARSPQRIYPRLRTSRPRRTRIAPGVHDNTERE